MALLLELQTLSLPGDFAFKTQEFNVTTNGITTTIHSMIQKIHHYKIEEESFYLNIGSVEDWYFIMAITHSNFLTQVRNYTEVDS